MSSWFEFLSSKGTLKLKNVLPAKGAQKKSPLRRQFFNPQNDGKLSL